MPRAVLHKTLASTMLDRFIQLYIWGGPGRVRFVCLPTNYY